MIAIIVVYCVCRVIEMCCIVYKSQFHPILQISLGSCVIVVCLWFISPVIFHNSESNDHE